MMWDPWISKICDNRAANLSETWTTKTVHLIPNLQSPIDSQRTSTNFAIQHRPKIGSDVVAIATSVICLGVEADSVTGVT
jgi:hypothetical protein